MGTIDNVRVEVVGKQCECKRTFAENGALLAKYIKLNGRMGRRLIRRHRFEARDNIEQVCVRIDVRALSLGAI